MNFFKSSGSNRDSKTKRSESDQRRRHQSDDSDNHKRQDHSSRGSKSKQSGSNDIAKPGVFTFSIF